MPEFIVIRNYKDKGYSEGSPIIQRVSRGTAIAFPFLLIKETPEEAYDIARRYPADLSRIPLHPTKDYMVSIESSEPFEHMGVKWMPIKVNILEAKPLALYPDLADTIVYNDDGKLILERQNGFTREYGYDSAGRLIKKITGGRIEEFTYDGDSLRILTSTKDGTTQTYRYDVAGRPLNSFDRDGEHMYWYDHNGRLIKHTLPNGDFSVALFNERGDSIYTRDHNGNESYWVYDTSSEGDPKLIFSYDPLKVRKEWVHLETGEVKFSVNGNPNGLKAFAEIVQEKARDVFSLDDDSSYDTIEIAKEIMQKEDPQ